MGQLSVSECDPNRWGNRSPTALPYAQRSTEWNEEDEEFARHGAYKQHKELFKTKRNFSDVDNTIFFRSHVPTQAKNTATGLAIQTTERVYIVDSGASLHMMGLLSLSKKEKKTVRQSSTILDIQTANGIVVSDTQAKVYIQELGAHL